MILLLLLMWMLEGHWGKVVLSKVGLYCVVVVIVVVVVNDIVVVDVVDVGCWGKVVLSKVGLCCVCPALRTRVIWVAHTASHLNHAARETLTDAIFISSWNNIWRTEYYHNISYIIIIILSNANSTLNLETSVVSPELKIQYIDKKTSKHWKEN